MAIENLGHRLKIEIPPFNENYPEFLVVFVIVQVPAIVDDVNSQFTVVFHKDEDVAQRVFSLVGSNDDVPKEVTGFRVQI